MKKLRNDKKILIFFDMSVRNVQSKFAALVSELKDDSSVCKQTEETFFTI